MVLSLISAIGSVVWNGRHKNDWYLYNNSEIFLPLCEVWKAICAISKLYAISL